MLIAAQLQEKQGISTSPQHMTPNSIFPHMFCRTYGGSRDGLVRERQVSLTCGRRGRPAGRPSSGPRPRKEGTCHTKIPRKNARAGGGVMNALPPNASPAACVQDAERPGPWRITACASVAARSGARPSAEGARRPGQPAYFTPAEMPNGAAGARVTGASGATGHGGRLACARVAQSNSPLKAARCANPAARRGVNASGNNMPRGVQLASAADAVLE